ncbi:MAG: DUF45 domain-containing protein [Bacteroidetes bacterium]|nr:DUF45 domain-containing protein [Bacteroidota bacterium]
MDEITLGEITIEVELKDIKNIHLSVYPPKGRVRIAAPSRMNLDTIEMVHLLERNHNEKFITYMNHYLPEWKEVRKELNRLPVSHREWGY